MIDFYIEHLNDIVTSGKISVRGWIHECESVDAKKYVKWIDYYYGHITYEQKNGYTLATHSHLDDEWYGRDDSEFFFVLPSGDVYYIHCVPKITTMRVNEANAWKLYNFINDWKSGKFGIVSLQEAIEDNFRI